MGYSPKTFEIELYGHTIHFRNQKSFDWTHPYTFNGTEDLTSSGCGIFALCHCVEWMHGLVLDPDEVADIAVALGARGNDGTNRPRMLGGMADNGCAAKWGFRYEKDGLLNDREKLWQHIVSGNTALCNLHPGHIVALVAARIAEGQRQLLVIDSCAQSWHEQVRPHIFEILENSEVTFPYLGKNGIETGMCRAYSVFWIDADLPKNFNLLYRTEIK